MSVIQRIRDKATWVFVIIAVALISFILQDAFTRKDRGLSGKNTLGKVNGTSIDKKTFDATVDLFQRMSQMQNMQVDREQLYSQAWEQVVQLTLFQEEFQKLGLSFTGKELSELMLSNTPPPMMRQLFTDPSTGQYNIEQVREALKTIKTKQNTPEVVKFYETYIQPTIDQALVQKYQILVAGATYVPKWLGEKVSADNNAIAQAAYVYVPYSSVTDTSKITDDEISKFVSKHEKEFQRKEESRTISYVAFDASPSAADSAAVRSVLDGVKSEFAASTDEKAFVAIKGSALPYTDMYITKSNMKMPLADSIMHLGSGQILGPYVDAQNYVLAKMISKREIPDSVKCRHILIKTKEQGQTVLADSVAKKKMDSIVAAIKGGADFNTMVQQYSDDQGSKASKGEYEFHSTQFAGISKEFAETVFYGNTGDKKVVKVENGGYSGYHYIEVLEQKAKQEAYKVAYLSKPLGASQETISAASTASQQFAAAARDKKLFDATADTKHLPVVASPDIAENDFAIQNLGSTRQFVRWIYEHNAGDVSEPVECGDKYIVAVITSVNKPGVLSAAAARPYVEGALRNEKKAKLILNKLKGNSLETYAQSAGVTVERADSLSFQRPFVMGLGNEPKLVGAAFNKNLQSKVSEPIAGVSGVFVVQGVSVSAVPSAGAEAERAQLESQLRRQAAYSTGALREAATIKDYRSKFF